MNKVTISLQIQSRWLLTLLAGLIALTVGMLVVAQATAQTLPPSDDEVNAIAKQMYCPVCENIPLDVCPTQACAQWRELIREKIGQGWSEQQIKDYFVLQYGDRVLAEPPRRGLNWLVYILPPLFFLVGVFIVYKVMKSMRRPAGQLEQASTDIPTNDPYMAELEKELREHK